jgi:hypothetical protein
MQFKLLSRTISVHIVSNLIRDGALREGIFDPDTDRILISDTVPRDRRRAVLLHELRHAWIELHGTPEPGSENDATDVGSFADYLIDAYQEQGGDDCLEAMNPAAQRMVERAVKVTVRDRVECKCGTVIMAGDVNNGEVEYLPLTGLHYMQRWMDCEACGRLTVWREQCSEDGIALGAFLPDIKVFTGRERLNWLRERSAAMA